MYYKTTAHGLPQIITEADYKNLTPGKRMLYVECNPNEPIGIGAPLNQDVAREVEKFSHKINNSTPPVLHGNAGTGKIIQSQGFGITGQIQLQDDDDTSALNALMFGIVGTEILDGDFDNNQPQIIYVEPVVNDSPPVQDPAPFEGMGGGSFGGGGSSDTWDSSQQQPDVQDTYQQPDPEPYEAPQDTTDYSTSSDDN